MLIASHPAFPSTDRVANAAALPRHVVGACHYITGNTVCLISKLHEGPTCPFCAIWYMLGSVSCLLQISGRLSSVSCVFLYRSVFIGNLADEVWSVRQMYLNYHSKGICGDTWEISRWTEEHRQQDVFSRDSSCRPLHSNPVLHGCLPNPADLHVSALSQHISSTSRCGAQLSRKTNGLSSTRGLINMHWAACLRH